MSTNSQEALVFTNGCFDVIHRGHIELLKYCASLGRVLVGLNSDDSVRRLKGPTRPINRLRDRLAVLEAIRFVDSVAVFDDLTPLRLIEQVSPDIIVKGGDYVASEVIGRDLAEVRIFPYLTGFSSSDILNRIQFQR